MPEPKKTRSKKSVVKLLTTDFDYVKKNEKIKSSEKKIRFRLKIQPISARFSVVNFIHFTTESVIFKNYFKTKKPQNVFCSGIPLLSSALLCSLVLTDRCKYREYALSPSMRHELVMKNLKVLKLDGYGGQNTFWRSLKMNFTNIYSQSPSKWKLGFWMHVSICNNTVVPFVYFPIWFLKILLLKNFQGTPYL